MTVSIPLSKYGEYKKSCVKWVKRIPNHWEIKKLKYISLIYNGDSLNSSQKEKFESITPEDMPYISSKDIDRNFSIVNYDSGLKIPLDSSKFKVAPKNACLICIEGGSAGRKIAFTNEKVCFVNKLACIYSAKKANNKFIFYSLKGDLFQSQFISSMSGLIGGVALSELKNFHLTLPPIEEQNNIVLFLDRKISQIDEAIRIKEQQIDLLKERKQIIIQQAVTQGLYSDVPMKCSGVDWIGKIPKHWEALRLKYLFKEINLRTKTGKEMLYSLRMIQGLIPHDEVSDKPIPDSSLVGYKIVQSGQLVMNRMRAAIGIFGLSSSYGLVSPDYAVFDIGPNANADYFLRLFKLTLMGTQFRLNSKGLGTGSSGFMRLYTESFGDIKIPLPSIKEQLEINSYIKEQSVIIDRVVKIQQQQIEKLKEYKTILINSAVTGKIKIEGNGYDT